MVRRQRDVDRVVPVGRRHVTSGGGEPLLVEVELRFVSDVAVKGGEERRVRRWPVAPVRLRRAVVERRRRHLVVHGEIGSRGVTSGAELLRQQVHCGRQHGLGAVMHRTDGRREQPATIDDREGEHTGAVANALS